MGMIVWMPIAIVSGVAAPLMILVGIVFDSVWIFCVLIFCVFGIGFGVFQLKGAIHYNVRMLVTCLIFHLFSLAFSLCFLVYSQFEFDVQHDPEYGLYFFLLFNLLWIYPVANLITDINKGIMSKETYPREAHGELKVDDESVIRLV